VGPDTYQAAVMPEGQFVLFLLVFGCPLFRHCTFTVGDHDQVAFLCPNVVVLLSEHLDATAANMRFVKPLDEALILRLADGHDLLVTLEENVLMGGAGSAVGEFLNKAGHPVKMLNLGLPDYFIEQASVEQQLQEAQLDLDSNLGAVSDALGPVEVSLGRKSS